jgi:hypothetical protein
MLVVRVTENVRAVQSSYYSSCPCLALAAAQCSVYVRGYAAKSALDALFYKTKLDCTNWFIFSYGLGELVDYTRTKFQHPSSLEKKTVLHVNVEGS